MISSSIKTKINENYDIIIVGGGPSGISTLLHLYKHHPEIAFKCLLLEKEKYPREKLCGGAVGGWSEDILKALGIKLNINSLMIDTVECRYNSERYVLNEPNYFRMVQRKEFDHFLAKKALRKGLKIHQEEYFLDFKRSNKSLIVETNKEIYRIKALIGADGSLSNVRKKINNNFGNLAPTIEIFSPVNPEFDREFEEKKVIFDFTSLKQGLQGYVWHFPCLRENRSFVNHGIVNFKIHNINSRISMKKIFIDELQKRNIDYEKIQLLGHPIRYLSKNDFISKSNVILTGDAAGIEPATGGGIHLALSYGKITADAIINAYKKDNFSFEDYKKIFEKSLTGRYINKLSLLAFDMYRKKINPLKVMKEIFIKRDT